MKLSSKQAMMLLDIAKDSLHILGNVGGYSPEVRLQLVNDVINQQSNTLKDTDEPNEQDS
jgi:hypothetical protein